MDRSVQDHALAGRRRTSIILGIIFLCALLISCPLNAEYQPPLLPEPITGTTVILFIGDGMGFQHIQATETALGRELSFSDFQSSTQVETRSASSSITDSAAAATAMATGISVANGVISMSPQGTPYETLLEFSEGLGKPTGIVTTARLVHATPAAFGAHAPNRSDTTAIATSYLQQTTPDILFGGGGDGLTPTMVTDAGYLLAEDRTAMVAFTVPLSGSEVALPLPHYAGLFGTTHLPFVIDGRGELPSLTEMTMQAIELLSALDITDSGFFLMVEAGRIDHAAHANDLVTMIKEVEELSETVGVVMDWVGERDDVIVVVTADHETGGLTKDHTTGDHYFTTTGHTGVDVPLYASGVGDLLFSRERIKNTWIHLILKGYYH